MEEKHTVSEGRPFPQCRDWVPLGQVQSGARMGKMPAGCPLLTWARLVGHRSLFRAWSMGVGDPKG